jgi:hypothetical protein
MTTRSLILLPALTLLACSTDPSPDRAEIPQRQRDSTIAESRLPGAPAVGRALDAADAAAAADSIR